MLILTVTFRRGVNKIDAIKFIRNVGKIGLKEAKELIETLQTTGTNFDIAGTLRLRVDAAYALSRLIEDTYTMGKLSMENPFITVRADLSPAVVDLSGEREL